MKTKWFASFCSWIARLASQTREWFTTAPAEDDDEEQGQGSLVEVSEPAPPAPLLQFYNALERKMQDLAVPASLRMLCPLFLWATQERIYFPVGWQMYAVLPSGDSHVRVVMAFLWSRGSGLFSDPRIDCPKGNLMFCDPEFPYMVEVAMERRGLSGPDIRRGLKRRVIYLRPPSRLQAHHAANTK